MKIKFLLSGAALALSIVSTYTYGANPSWWSDSSAPVVEERGATEENYAPANLGQLKHIAKRAAEHLDQKLVGDAGGGVWAVVDLFEPRIGVTYTQQELDSIIAANYAPINLGQLKRVAKPFYDRLNAAGYNTKANLQARGFPNVWASPLNWSGYFPWNPATPVADNYSPANIGQLKMVFSFDLATFDTDEDGIADAWEQEIVNADPFDDVETLADVNPLENLDGDSLSNIEEFQLGLDPLNPSDAPGKFVSVSGNEQTVATSGQAMRPLVLLVIDSLNRPMTNKGVVAKVRAGDGEIRASGSGSFGKVAQLITNSEGKISLDCRVGALDADVIDLSFEASFAPIYLSRIYSEGWLGIWRFDESSGSTSADDSRFNRKALLNSATRSPGKAGISVSMAASLKTFIEVEKSAQTLHLGHGSFTGMFWIKTTFSGAATVLSQGYSDGSPGFKFDIGRQGAGRLSFTVGQLQGESVIVTPEGTFNDGDWHHVAFVVDRDENIISVFVDGLVRQIQLGEAAGGPFLTSAPLSPTVVANTNKTLVFGWAVGTAEYFEGSLDEIHLYRGVLSDTKIAEHATTALNVDDDEMPDSWEQQIVNADLTDLVEGVEDVLAEDDYDGDGVSNLAEYLAGTSPVDYYNGGSARIFIEQGNGQIGVSGTVLPHPVTVRVENDGGTTLINAPILIKPADPSAKVGSSGSALSNSFKIRTGWSTKFFVQP